MKKLQHFLSHRFYQKQLDKNTKLGQDFQFLDQYLDEFFPTQNYINATMKNLEWLDRDYHTIFNIRFLPFHTRDEIWLARYVEKSLSQLLCFENNQGDLGAINHRKELPYATLNEDKWLVDLVYRNMPVEFSSIRKYVEVSPKFDAKRCEYEQGVVRGYMRNWLSDCQANDFFMKGEDKVRLANNLNCDKKFRNKVSQAMASLGIDKDSVEAGIELNADLWRKNLMRRAFYNEKTKLEHDQLETLFKYDFPVLKDLLVNEYRNLDTWVQLREYDYYQDHKAVIDQLGTATPSMKLNPDEAMKLRIKNRQFDYKYESAMFNGLMSVMDCEDVLDQGKEQ